MTRVLQMGKWINENFEKIFLAVGLFASFMLITFQVIYRFFIIKAGILLPVSWVEELARIIFIWISYLAVPIAIKKRDLIRIDAIYNILPEKGKKISWIIIDTLLLVVTGVLFICGYEHVCHLMRFPSATAAMKLPYWMAYLVLPIGFGLCVLRLVQDYIRQFKECGLKYTIIGIILAGITFLPLVLHVNASAALWLFGYFILYLILGMPIAFSLGLSALMVMWGCGTMPVGYAAQLSYTGLDSVPIMAVPFFIAAGNFMGEGGLSKRLIAVADDLLGSFTGGLALATILTCMLFAAMSGSGPATVAAIGALTIPAMVERGYDKRFAAALVACAGTIGVLIPPSTPLVLYGIAANTNIAKLFMAGLLPGILVGVALMLVAYVTSRKNGWRGEKRERSWKRTGALLWDAKWALLVPVIILGGIYSGICTPTESAAIAATYGLIVGLFLYKELNIKSTIKCLIESGITSSIVIILLAQATIFGNILTILQIPTMIAEAIIALTTNKILILLLINILLLIIGTFMDAGASIIVLTPILLPIVVQLGVDPIHFGVMMILNLSIGFVTPPVGVNLFVASSITKMSLQDMVGRVIPFLISMITVLLLVTYIPTISMALVNIFY